MDDGRSGRRRGRLESTPSSGPSARLDAGQGPGLFEFESQFQQSRFATDVGGEHHADWHTVRGFGQRQGDSWLAGDVGQRRERVPVDPSVDDLL
jgi:hypothetical protein